MLEVRHRPPSDAHAVLLRQFDANSLTALRDRVRGIGERFGLTDLDLTKFVLVVHELAVNAVRHGGGQGEIRLWPEDGVIGCEIRDEGRGIPRKYVDAQRRPTGTRVRGNGLWLVRHICPNVRVETGPGGTRVLISYPVERRS